MQLANWHFTNTQWLQLESVAARGTRAAVRAAVTESA